MAGLDAKIEEKEVENEEKEVEIKEKELDGCIVVIVTTTVGNA